MDDLLADPVVKGYLFYSSVVLGKTMVVGLWTAATRIRKKIFANPEDAKTFEGKVKLDDVDVERIRRCHLNDMENVYMFVFLGGLYCATRPSTSTALWHFRVFTAARILHSIFYLNEFPPQLRGLSWFTGLGVCISMAGQVIAATL